MASVSLEDRASDSRWTRGDRSAGAGRAAGATPADGDAPRVVSPLSADREAQRAERWLERRIAWAFAFALAVLVGLAALSFWSLQTLLRQRADANQTRIVVDEIARVGTLLRDAETGQRGFLLTGRDDYLEPFRQAESMLDARLQRLRELTAASDSQSRRVERLMQAQRTLRDGMRATIDARRNAGAAPALARDDDNGGKARMDTIRALLDEMQYEERQLLDERIAKVDRAGALTLSVLPAGSIIAVLVTTAAFLAIRRELRTRQALEQATRELNRELERSNRELQDFAYVASHDLQEPLRKIQAFGDRLVVKHGPALDDQAQDYLRRMLSAARRMQALINDLLTYSRVATRGAPFVVVNLDEVMQDVLSDLELQVQRTEGEVLVPEPLPTLEADATQMRQLLQNLVSNALKFRDPARPPRVQVTARPLEGRDDALELVVADNGIGFDEKYLDRIFTPFQRLHSRDQYEGTGIGLAVCRRIVERHGGVITARSVPGEGSRFVAVLPRHHSEDIRS